MFDRSRPDLPDGRRLEQADGTAWMGLFCLDMLAIALELSRTRPAYEAIATKFFEHFLAISHAINGISEIGLWDPVDRLLLRRDPGRGGAARTPEGPVVRGPDAALRRPDHRAGHAGAAAPLPAADGVVPEVPADARGQPPAHDAAGRRRGEVAHAGGPAQAGVGRAADARPGAVPLGLRPAVALARAGRRALCLRRGARRVRAGRVVVADLRRQLQLARADLVPGELPDDRGAAGVSSLLRVEPDRRAAARRPGPGDARPGRGRDRPAIGADLPPRPRRPPAGPGGRPALPVGPALARPRALLRVFPRRGRLGPGRQPSDRLDGAGRRADLADRRRAGPPGPDAGTRR